MPAEAAATFAGIHNENEFYSHHYLSEIFTGDIRETVARWREAAADGSEGTRPPHDALRALARDYVQVRRRFERERRHDARLRSQRGWFRQLLAVLGYGWSPTNHALESGVEVPVLVTEGVAAGAPRLLGVCRIGRTEEAKECWSGLRSDYRLHESMLSQIVG